MSAKSQADGLIEVIARKDRELSALRSAAEELEAKWLRAKQACSASYNVLSRHDLLTQHSTLADELLEIVL